ncbi:Glutamine amidotransferase, class I [plant metagenome]|uniref:Glutamine amidotransferase, class I n=1 Tax=plant metagenome TaxID=1297885 RepID=A0A484TKB0_9ZZZZ
MKTALVLRHLHFEDLGTFAPVLQAQGYALRYIDPGVDDLAGIDALQPDLLVVLGGPIGAFDDDRYPFLAAELTLVRQRLAARLPILGICLGAQLMARALGARVASMGVKEIGYAPLTLTPEGRASPLAALAGVPVLHWHGDRYEIPDGAIRLASTPVCDNQAFALGAHALGLQCHLEADAARIERWLVGHACELEGAGIDPRALREAARQAQATLPDAARRCLSAWLAALETA